MRPGDLVGDRAQGPIGHAVIDEALVGHGHDIRPATPGTHQSSAGAYGWSRGDASGLGEGAKPPPRRRAHAAQRVFLERVGEVPAQQIAAEPWRKDPMPAAPGTAQRRQIHRLNGRQLRSDVGHERSSANRRAPSVLAPPPPGQPTVLGRRPATDSRRRGSRSEGA